MTQEKTQEENISNPVTMDFALKLPYPQSSSLPISRSKSADNSYNPQHHGLNSSPIHSHQDKKTSSPSSSNSHEAINNEERSDEDIFPMEYR